ncbi:MAG: hypothetical protein M3153_00440 [Chloroflexota bacterium]|nr:hypothetical protein [Chloroflexota bacterium]
METRLGILRWDQATDWQSNEDAARRLDELDHHHLWASDHLYATPAMPIGGSPRATPRFGAWANGAPRANRGRSVTASGTPP